MVTFQQLPQQQQQQLLQAIRQNAQMAGVKFKGAVKATAEGKSVEDIPASKL